MRNRIVSIVLDAPLQPRLGKALRKARSQHRMSLLEVAGAIDASASGIASVERGETVPGTDLTMKLCRLYKVEIL